MCNQNCVRFVVASVDGRYDPTKALFFAITEALVFLLVPVGAQQLAQERRQPVSAATDVKPESIHHRR
jgi:hypothetical protein